MISSLHVKGCPEIRYSYKNLKIRLRVLTILDKTGQVQ